MGLGIDHRYSADSNPTFLNQLQRNSSYSRRTCVDDSYEKSEKLFFSGESRWAAILYIRVVRVGLGLETGVGLA